MKYFLLTFFIALAATVSSNAQTLQVDPIYVGGTAAFEVQGGTPGGVAIVCYSINGTGPFTLANGLSLDLSMPIKQLSPMVLNGIGDGSLGPFPTPSSAIVGMQVWFQAVDVNIWGNQILSATNMVPVVVQNIPNNPPTAIDDDATAHTNMLVTIDVMANDSDIDGDDIALFSVSAPANGGSAFINGDMIDYVSAPGFSGTETFTYQLEDAQGAQDTATVTVTVLTGGSLDAWGRDDYNQCHDTPLGNDFTQVSSLESHNIALRLDSSLYSWGSDGDNQVTNTPTGNDFIQVSAGGHYSIALRSNGSLVTWGTNSQNQITDTPSGNDFIQVDAGHSESVAIRIDGSLVSWGDDHYNQVSDSPLGNDFIQAVAGYYHAVALRSDGTLISWGRDDESQVLDTPLGNDFVYVAAGGFHSVAIKADGSLVSWGDDTDGQVLNTPPGNDFVQVDSGESHSIGLKSDGTLISWGRDNHSQVLDTPLGNGFYQIAAGQHHSLAIFN